MYLAMGSLFLNSCLTCCTTAICSLMTLQTEVMPDLREAMAGAEDKQTRCTLAIC